MRRNLLVIGMVFLSAARAEASFDAASVPAGRCGTPQLDRTGTVPNVRHAAPGAMRTIYLNRFGGSYLVGPGATDSATNHASMTVSGDGRTHMAVIPPMSSAFNWPAIRTCVREHYKRFNVRIVETEPTSGDYVEAVVGGYGTEIGFPMGQLFGIAAADNFCGVTERGIAFSFSETHLNVGRRDDELCATIAHEVGHLLALEHETLSPDLMSYVLIAQSNTKAFNLQDSPCGTQPGQNITCSCSAGTTNSGGRLTTFVGLRPVETTPPTLALVAPGGSEVAPTFDVTVTAHDDLAMEGVRFLLNGLEIGYDYEPDGDTYQITATGIAEGAYTLQVQATDQAGNVTMVEKPITVAKLALGESCTSAEQCQAGLCATSNDGNFCTQTCDPATACPSDFTCTETSGTSICVPDAGGCCSTGGSPGGPLVLTGLVAGLLLVRRRARYQSPRR